MDYWLWHEEESGTTGGGLRAPPSWYSESAELGDGPGTHGPGKIYEPWSSTASDETRREELEAWNAQTLSKQIPLQLDQIDTLHKNGEIDDEEAERMIETLKGAYDAEFFEGELKNYVIEAQVQCNEIGNTAGTSSRAYQDCKAWTAPTGKHLESEMSSGMLGQTSSTDKYNAFIEDVENFETLPVEAKENHKDLYGIEAGEEIPDDETLIPLSPAYSSNASDKERARLFITAHQCFLLHNLEALADFHRGAYYNSIGAIHNNAGETGPQSGTDSPYLTPDGQHRFLLVDDTNPEQAFAVANKLTCLGKIDNFTGITPAEAAHLVPNMRLFKTKGVGAEQKKVEMEFENFVDPSVFKKAQSDSALTGRAYAKGRGCGIKSFSWSYLGGDPFMATKDLQATLKIYFQDFRDLVELRSGDDVYKPGGERVDYRYVDLVLQGDCREAGAAPSSSTSDPPPVQLESSEYYYPECYEIAVELGYADVDWAGKVNSKIKDLIKRQTTTIYLIAVEHTFDINQDGTFELTIEYRGRLGEKLGAKGANILIAAGGSAKLNGTATNDVPEIGKLHWDLNVLEELRKEEERRTDSDAKSATLRKLKLLKEHITLKTHGSLYSGIVRTLFGRKMVYRMTVDANEIRQFTNFATFKRSSKVKLSIDNMDTCGPSTGFQPAVSADFTLADVSDDLSLTSSKEEDLVERMKATTHRSVTFTTVGDLLAVVFEHVVGESSVLPGMSGQFRHMIGIQYDTKEKIREYIEKVDVLDADGKDLSDEELRNELKGNILTGMHVGPASPSEQGAVPTTALGMAVYLENFRIILGNLTYDGINSDQKVSVNLAHLPISMHMFQKFMLKRVINSQRSFYSFREFVKDLLTDIIIENMGNSCFGGYFLNKPKAQLLTLTAAGARDNGADEVEPITSNENIFKPRAGEAGEPVYNVVDLSSVNVNNLVFPHGVQKASRGFDYLVFACNSPKDFSDNLTGKFDEDSKYGIPHFQFGAVSGFFKSATFNKTPIEFLAEERYVKEGASNMLNQLAGRYEMQCNLLGNNLFIPGQYIYFNPIAMGIGAPNYNLSDDNRSYANRMGLGGYHIITEVASTISPGKFETTLKALWETSGKSTGDSESLFTYVGASP